MTQNDVENHMVIGNDTVSTQELQLQQQREVAHDIESKIARQNEVNQAFVSGALKEEFHNISEYEMWTREDVIDECVDELIKSENMVNLLCTDIPDEVKLKVLSDIREKIINQMGEV